jgi:hypothetical protein
MPEVLVTEDSGVQTIAAAVLELRSQPGFPQAATC